ncbi:MAG: thioredoxin [Candidatus Aminicenantes bacterium]|nr:thioredoxin [Candidatus Aminicenantes bacterium]
MLIDDRTREFLEHKYNQELKNDVDIKVFTRDIIIGTENPEYAQFSKGLVQEISQIHPKIKAEYYNLGDDTAKKWNISFSPTIVLGSDNGYSIQYWGVPMGQIAMTFVETISLVSRGESGLDSSFREKCKYIDENLLVETYFDVNSPPSSQTVLLNNKIAVELPGKVVSRSIEAGEAEERIRRFGITELPSVVINEKQESLLSGMISKENMLRRLIEHGASQKEKVLEELEEEEKKKRTLLDNPDIPIILSTSNFDEAVKKYAVLVVDCWAEWCAPCQMVHPILENLAKKYKGKVAFGKLDIDHNQEIAQRFRIMSIPNLLVFKNGQNVDSIIGAMPQEALEQRLKKYLE